MKGNVRSSYCKLKRRAQSHPLISAPLNKEIDCSSGVPAHTAVTFFDAVRWDSVEVEVASILWFPSANHLVKRRRLPTCCRLSGVTRNWGTPCRRTAGTRATSRYGGAMWRIILVVLHSNVMLVNIKIHTASSLSPQLQQPLNQPRMESPVMMTPPSPWWRRTKVSVCDCCCFCLVRGPSGWKNGGLQQSDN